MTEGGRLRPEQISRIVAGTLADPHSLLGMHPFSEDDRSGVVVRAFLQGARESSVLPLNDERGEGFSMTSRHPAGLFELVLSDCKEVFAYRLRVTYEDGQTREFRDPYAFLPTLSDVDLHLFNEGTDHCVYDKLGAQVRSVDGASGVSFSVWAPSAQRVAVVGDFNGWDARYHPLRCIGSSGVWELFVPGLAKGVLYKYAVVNCHGTEVLKTDPYGAYFEPPPNNASIVYSGTGHEWTDDEWLARRQQTDWSREPISVYEVHLGSWKRVAEEGERPLTYREMALELSEYVREMGYTHVEFMPVSEYPYEGSWGYQVTGFFAPTHRYGTPNDFKFLVDTLHGHGIGVILDWVPAHFPRDAFALAEFDGTKLYEHADPRQGHHLDWGTLIFNYGRPEVRAFLVGSALAWFERFHIDGLRVDAVASMLYLDYSRPAGQWVANEHGGRENLEAISFLRYVNDTVHARYPGALMIAEESTAWGGVTAPVKEHGLGFDLKWNMGWMHDTLEYFKLDPIHRKFHHHQLTFGADYQSSERFMLAFSHDEVVHGKASLLLKMGAEQIPEKAGHLRALYGWMWAWPGKKTLFMGNEFGQASEWAYDRSLDWHLLQFLDHEGIRCLVKDLNQFYREHPVWGENDFESQRFRWISRDNGSDSVISFARLGYEARDSVVIVANLTPITREFFRVGVPHAGVWVEALNTSLKRYGGSGQRNRDRLQSESICWDGQDQVVHLDLPGMSTMFLTMAPLGAG